jgi:hypothetical protein
VNGHPKRPRDPLIGGLLPAKPVVRSDRRRAPPLLRYPILWTLTCAACGSPAGGAFHSGGPLIMLAG